MAANEFRIVNVPYDEWKSDVRVIRNELNDLRSLVKLLISGEDKLIRIGGVKEILQSKNIKCTDNRTVQRWLEENNIRTQHKQGSTSKYYSKNEVLKCLN